jgi:hypothetical protein
MSQSIYYSYAVQLYFFADEANDIIVLEDTKTHTSIALTFPPPPCDSHLAGGTWYRLTDEGVLGKRSDVYQALDSMIIHDRLGKK